MEQRELEDQAKIERLRAAVKVGLDDIESGNYFELRSHADVDGFVEGIVEQAIGEHETGTASRVKRG
jgi:antitoxin ParD1/3/4